MGDIKNEACFIFACFFSYEHFLHRTNLDTTTCSVFLLRLPPWEWLTPSCDLFSCSSPLGSSVYSTDFLNDPIFPDFGKSGKNLIAFLGTGCNVRAAGWREGSGGLCFSEGEELTGQTYWGGLGDLHISRQFTGYAFKPHSWCRHNSAQDA